MITPFDLFTAAVVALIGCGVIAVVCTWVTDCLCGAPNDNLWSDLQIVVTFSLGPICAIPLWFVFFVLMSRGRMWN